LANDCLGYPCVDNYTWYNLIPAASPTLWIDEVMTIYGVTEDVKVFKRNFNNQNDADCEIYYLKNKREWQFPVSMLYFYFQQFICPDFQFWVSKKL